MLSTWATCDALHHCDACKHYRDGLGPNSSSVYTYTLETGEQFLFLVPSVAMEMFHFSEGNELQSLKLPKVLKGAPGEAVKILKGEGVRGDDVIVKTPIMMSSFGRCEHGECGML